MIKTSSAILKQDYNAILGLVRATLRAAQDINNVIWVGVRWVCLGMGMTQDQMKNERKRIGKDIVLSLGVKYNPLGTGNRKDVLCLQLDYLPLWLAKISITPAMKRDNPELVEKLVEYQLKAKDVESRMISS